MESYSNPALHHVRLSAKDFRDACAGSGAIELSISPRRSFGTIYTARLYWQSSGKPCSLPPPAKESDDQNGWV